MKTRHPATPTLPAPPREGEVILFNKPYGVLCQFTGDGTRRTLADFIRVPDVYPTGRLDADSEGLVILTADGRLQARIANPRHKLPKVYWAQVEGVPQPAQLQALADGLVLADGPTRPAKARLLDPPPDMPSRDPPIRHRLTVPTAWLELTLTEGRNRQVRRMTAAVGLPTLRLVRVAVGPFTLDGLAPGTWRAQDGRAAMV
ncbi:MAG: pseudouridine synthase [Betaproteobacteria bacterium]